MKRKTGAFIVATALISGITAPAYAVRQSGDLETEVGLRVAAGDPARIERAITYEVPHATRPAWDAFTRAFGADFHGFFDAHTGVPGRIYGGSIPAPDSVASPIAAEAAARRVLAAHIALFAPGSSVLDFELVSNEAHRGMRTVAFIQRHRGLEVIGGQINFRFKNDRLFVIGSEAIPHLRLEPPRAILSAKDATSAAVRWIAQDLGARTELRGVNVPQILPIVRATGAIDHHAVIEVKLYSSAPLALWAVYVDAGTGAPIARRQLLKFADATIKFNSPDRWPGSTRSDVPAALNSVTIEGMQLDTDANGLVSWTGDGAAQATLRARGPLVRVVNAAGPSISNTVELMPGGTYVWDRRDVSMDDAQLITFISSYIVKARAKLIAPDITWFDTDQLEANVNMDSACNAFSDGETINFFQAGQGCENTGRLPDVIYHEFGHAVHFQAITRGAGQFDTSLSEGAADYLAGTITNDNGMGRGFFFDNRPLRDLDPRNDRVWPDDIAQDPHETGLIFGGAMWDLRKALIASMGEAAGIEHTDFLWIEALRTSADIPSSYAEVMAADDDDGNLGNGTPNVCAINEAFSRHGLADPTTSGPGIRSPVTNGLVITLPVMRSGLCPGTEIREAKLTWQVRGMSGSGGDLSMGPVADGYSVEIPAQNPGTVVQYQIQVTLGDGSTRVMPDNRADPYYELFVGTVTVIYCTDFEGDPLNEGWSHRLVSGEASQGADDWQFGTPQGTQGSGDPSAAYSGTKVAGNDLGGGNYNGKYQSDKTNVLSSPEIDTMGFTNVRLHYYRWLTVEDGFYDHARILSNGTEVWANVVGDMEGSLAHQDREWRFQDVDLTPTVQDSRVKIDFQLESDGGLEFGGWTIDDLCIVGYGDVAVLPVCGNGTLEMGEVCDDGNQVAGDGCEADCTSSPPPVQPGCGNGLLEAGEACDDGNAIDGDGCDSSCTITPPGMMGSPVCGNGTIEAGEQCDDGILDGNACAPGCRLPAITGGTLEQEAAGGCGCSTAGNARHDLAALVDLLLVAALALVLTLRARRQRA